MWKGKDPTGPRQQALRKGLALDRMAVHIGGTRYVGRDARRTSGHRVRGLGRRARWVLLEQRRYQHVDPTVRRVRVILPVVRVQRTVDRPQVRLAGPPLSARPRRKEYRNGDVTAKRASLRTLKRLNLS
jgi:hypothetical protein